MTIAVYFVSCLVAGFTACCLLEAWSKRHARKLRYDAAPIQYKPIRVNVKV